MVQYELPPISCQLYADSEKVDGFVLQPASVPVRPQPCQYIAIVHCVMRDGVSRLGSLAIAECMYITAVGNQCAEKKYSLLAIINEFINSTAHFA